MEPVYVKRFIKSEADLPKEDGFYLCHIIDDDEIKQWSIRPSDQCFEEDKNDWMENIDWYLEPVEIPTEEEINTAGQELFKSGMEQEDAFDGQSWEKLCLCEKQSFIAGVNWLLSKLTNKQ